VHDDRRERFYENILLRSTSARPQFDHDAIAASLNLAFSYDTQESYLWRPMGTRGLARSSFYVLMLLRHARPEGLQLSEIGDLLITSRANITGLIDHLEQKGYVKRIIDSLDRRVRLAKLTKKGETLIDEIMPAHIERSIAFFSNLTLDEVQQLTGLLRKIRQSPVVAHAGREQSAALDPVFATED
jgi:MarR family transcriptional regulator, 2-MHQ and catechol-resistance regulon repressor